MESLSKNIDAPDASNATATGPNPDCTGTSPSEDPVRKLHAEATSLKQKFHKTSRLEDIQEAVAKYERTLRFASEDHPEIIDILHGLSVCLERRAAFTDNLDDLHKAISRSAEARDIAARRNEDVSHLLSNMATFNAELFGHTGDTKFLQNAANLFEETITDATPHRGRYLYNLGCIYGTRYQWTYAMEDIEQSITKFQDALNVPEDQNQMTTMLHIGLGNALALKYNRSRDLKDIGEAISQAEEALECLDPEDTTYLRPIVLGHLGNWLARKYEKTKSLVDIDRAIDNTREAIRRMNPKNDHVPVQWNDLGSALAMKYMHSNMPETNSLEVIQEAIDSFRESIKTCTQEAAPEQGTRYLNLGRALSLEYERTKTTCDFNSTLKTFKVSWNWSNAQPLYRIEGASEAAELLITKCKWDEASALLDGAVNLLPTVAPRSLRQKDQQYLLGHCANLATTAACIALKAGKGPSHALRLLELGRGVIANLLFGSRINPTVLDADHLKLAEFERLRDILDTPSEANISMTLRYEANQKLERLLKTPELESLLHLSEEQMMQSAEAGPIAVINVSRHGCDAILVQKKRKNSIQVVHLNDLHESDISGYAKHRESTETLEWLWRVAVGPTLEALGLKHPALHCNWPRIWWIPTGKLSLFPLHAAGDYSRGPSLSVLDAAISSYSLSIQSLMYSRQLRDKRDRSNPSTNALLVSMSQTPGSSHLTYAQDEIQALEKILPMPTVTLQEPIRQDVLKQLRTCSIFHFAGHGESNPVDPSESRLLLKDWPSKPLTVAHLMELKLVSKPPLLAYLSACSTGENQVDHLMDESIHLMSACQLAGFQHVVGSLWKVGDESSMSEAMEVYKAVDNAENDIALGVHNAAIRLRDQAYFRGQDSVASSDDVGGRGIAAAVREEDDLIPWAAYIHIGP